jgi:hypothetical protein
MTQTQRALAIHLIAWALARVAFEELSSMRQSPSVSRARLLIYRSIYQGEDPTLESIDDPTIRVVYVALETAAARFQSLFPDQTAERGERPLPLALVRLRMRVHLESWRRARDIAVKLLTAGLEGHAIVLLIFRIAVLGEALEAVTQSVQEPEASLLLTVLDRELLGTI